MKIEKQVETCVDVEVHVSVEDIACAIAEETNALPDVLRGINNCHTFLRAIPDAIIERMNENQKRTIYNAMLLQINRYSSGDEKDCACPGGQAEHLNSCVYCR
jgi:hypothetical protein